MDRFEKRAAEIMRLGEKRIAEKKRRSTIIRRSAASTGACAAAIAGVWLMSGKDLKDAAKPHQPDVVIAGTTVSAETQPATGSSRKTVQTTVTSAKPVSAASVSSSAATASTQAVRTTASNERGAVVRTEPAVQTVPVQQETTAPAITATSPQNVQTTAATQTAPASATAPVTQTATTPASATDAQTTLQNESAVFTTTAKTGEEMPHGEFIPPETITDIFELESPEMTLTYRLTDLTLDDVKLSTNFFYSPRINANCCQIKDRPDLVAVWFLNCPTMFIYELI